MVADCMDRMTTFLSVNKLAADIVAAVLPEKGEDCMDHTMRMFLSPNKPAADIAEENREGYMEGNPGHWDSESRRHSPSDPAKTS
jgi:hypothetical protein